MKPAHIRSALRGAGQGLQSLQPLGQGSPQGRGTAVGGGLGQPLAVGEGEEQQLVREGVGSGSYCMCTIGNMDMYVQSLRQGKGNYT